jgi:hypothetical protein
MDCAPIPAAVEPDYWHVVFHPSETRLARLVLGEFQHVSALTYVAGFRAWVMYDAQWSGLRLSFFAAPGGFTDRVRDCAIVKVNCRHEPIGILSRAGFYCVPAIKHLLGLSCVAVLPDQLYRHLINNGGIMINEHVRTGAAAGSDAGRRASPSPG